MLRRVAAIVQEPVQLFELAVVCEVFGLDRTADGLPRFDFAVCASSPRRLMTNAGVGLTDIQPLAPAREADLVIVSAGPVHGPFDPEILQLLRDVVDDGRRVMSVCAGAFTLAAAGLLDGRRAATHWMYASHMAQAFPDVILDMDVLYVEDGPVVTSAGTAAGIDACLHLIRSEFGSEAAATISRRMVVSPHRAGGQRQYIDAPIPVMDGLSLQPTMEWVMAHLDQPHTCGLLAARAHMSARTFARRFTQETGLSPGRWVLDQRIHYARRLIESTDLSIQKIATRSGFGTDTALRSHFKKRLGVSPTQYRQGFRDHPASVPDSRRRRTMGFVSTTPENEPLGDG